MNFTSVLLNRLDSLLFGVVQRIMFEWHDVVLVRLQFSLFQILQILRKFVVILRRHLLLRALLLGANKRLMVMGDGLAHGVIKLWIVIFDSLFVLASWDAQATRTKGLLLEDLLEFWHLCRSYRSSNTSPLVLLLVHIPWVYLWLNPLFNMRITICFDGLLPWTIFAWLILRWMLIPLHLIVITILMVVGLTHIVFIYLMPQVLLFGWVRKSWVIIWAQLWFSFKVNPLLL